MTDHPVVLVGSVKSVVLTSDSDGMIPAFLTFLNFVSDTKIAYEMATQ